MFGRYFQVELCVVGLFLFCVGCSQGVFFPDYSGCCATCEPSDLHGGRGPCDEKLLFNKTSSFPATLNASLQDAITKANLEATLQSLMRKHLVAGLSLIVIYDQFEVFYRGYGFATRQQNKEVPPNRDTIFQLASITKVFTVMMLLQMRDKGLVDSLEEKVDALIPEFKVRNSRGDAYARLNLRQIASQVSGLPTIVPCMQLECGEDVNNETVIIEKIGNLTLLFPPYSSASYSNLAYALLGRALQRVVPSKSYEEHLVKTILQPLKMNNTGFNYTQVANQMATGFRYNTSSNDWTPAPHVPDEFVWSAPMWKLYSSANDMGKFIKFLFDENSQQGMTPPILERNTVREWMQPVFLLNDQSSAFGMPWEMFISDNQWIRSKYGDNSYWGFTAHFAIVPELKLGVVALMNSPVSGGDPSVFTLPVLHTLIPVVQSFLQNNQPVLMLPPNWKYFLGDYSLDVPFGNILTISVASNPAQNTQYLTATLPFASLSKAPLTWLGGNALQVVMNNQNQDSCFGNAFKGTDGVSLFFNFDNGPNYPAMSGMIESLLFTRKS